MQMVMSKNQATPRENNPRENTMRSNRRQIPIISESDKQLLGLFREFIDELSCNNGDKAWTAHSKIMNLLKPPPTAGFRLLISLMCKYFLYLYSKDDKNQFIKKHEIEFRKDFKKFLENFDKKATELLQYPEYVVYILSQISWFCVDAYVQSVIPEQNKKNPEPDKELLYFLKQIYLTIKKIIDARKGCDEKIDKSSKLLLSSLAYITHFQDPVVKETINQNQNAYKLFFEGNLPSVIMASEKERLKNSKKEISKEQQCLLLCLEMQQYFNSIDITINGDSKQCDKDLIRKLKEFNYEKLAEFLKQLDINITGNLKESLPLNQETGINIYANLITIPGYFIPAAETYANAVSENDEEFKARLKSFNSIYYTCPVVRKYFGEEKCNEELDKINSSSEESIEGNPSPEILIPELVTMHDKFMDEYVLYLQEKIDKEVIFQSYDEIIKQIKKLPENRTARFIFSSMADYMYLNLQSDTASYNSYKSSTAHLLFILKDGGDAECLQHSRYIMWILVNAAKFCIKSYEYSPSNHKFLVMINEIKQAISGFTLLTNKNPDIYNKRARILSAKLSFVMSFLAIRSRVKKEHESQFNVFLRLRYFREEYKKAQITFSKSGSVDEQCALHWFDIFNCEITLAHDNSIKPFADLNCNQLINFIESLAINTIPHQHEPKHDLHIILMEKNIYAELIESTHTMIEKMETKIELDIIQFGDAINTKLCESYRLKIKLLEFKSRFYASGFVREVLTEEKYKEQIQDIENQIQSAHSSLLLFKQKLMPVIEKEKNEIKRQLRKLYDGKRQDKHNPKEIILPDNVMSIFARLRDAGITEAYLTGGSIRDAIEKLDPNDFDIAVNGSLSEIEKIFSAEGKIIYAKYPIFSIPENAGHKEIQIRPLSTLKHNDNANCDVITRLNGEKVYLQRTNDLSQDGEKLIFTFSSIYFDPFEKVFYDPYNGLADIRNKKIRFIKDPVETINQYKPVIFKIIRLMTRYGYTLDDDTNDILLNHMHLLRDENVFRLYNEINKTLKEADHHFILEKFREYNIFHYVYDFSEESSDELIEVLALSLDNEKIKNNPILLWAIILHPFLCDMLVAWDEESFFMHYPEQFNQLCDFYGIIEERNDLLRVIMLTYHRLHHSSKSMDNYSARDHFLADALIKQYYRLPLQKPSLQPVTSQLGLFSGSERPAHNFEITTAKDSLSLSVSQRKGEG